MTTEIKPLIRENYKREYYFRRTLPNDKVLLGVYSYFTARNEAEVAQPYYAKMQFDEATAPKQIGVSLKIGDKETISSGESQPSNRPLVAEWSSPSISVPPHQSVDVTWVYETITDIEGSDMITFSAPTSNVSVKIGGVASLILETVVESIPEATTCEDDLWVFNRPFLPGQFVNIRWWKKGRRARSEKEAHGHACRVCSARYNCDENNCTTSSYRICEPCWNHLKDNDHYRILGITERPFSDD